MEYKNRINKAEASAATDFRYGASSATSFRNGKPISASSEEEQVSLVTNRKRIEQIQKATRPKINEYDFAGLREEAASRARLKVDELEKEIKHLKATGGESEEVTRLERSLEHQRKIIERSDRFRVSGVRERINSARFYIDKDEQVKDYESYARIHSLLAEEYTQNAQISQNKARSATKASESSKYMSESKSAQERAQIELKRADKWMKKAEKASGKPQNSLGKARETIRSFQRSNVVRRTADRAVYSIRSGAKHVMSSLGEKFMSLMKSPGARTAVMMTLAFSFLLSPFSQFTYYVHAQERDDIADEAYIEYATWIERYNDEGDKFYKDYHAIVPSAYLVPISYTYYNQGVYGDILNEWFEQNPYSQSGKKRAEYLTEAYQYAIDAYFGEDLNPYQLRELFLDRVEYQYQYLAREYSDWVVDLESDEGYDESQSYTKMVMVDDYDYVDYGHTMTPDECNSANKTQASKDACIKNPPQVVDYQKYEKVGEHEEERTFYRGRNVTNEYWSLDKNDPNVDGDIHRTAVPDGYEQVKIPGLPAYQNGGYSPDYQENIGDHDSYWTYMYADSGIYVKRLRYWLLRSYLDVYSDIAYEYFPENEHDKALVLKKEDPVIGEITFEIERKYIYNVYFAKDQTGIYRENVFLDEHNLEYYQQMTFLYDTFVKLFSVSGIQFGEGKFLISPFFTAGLDAQSHITQHFAQIGVGNNGGQHGAIDFGFPKGTQINAMLDGTVVYIQQSIPENTSGNCATSPDSSGCHGIIGNEVEIESKMAGVDGKEHVIRIRYYHVLGDSPSEAGISVGSVVSAGQIIAKVGHNGKSTGAHLHLAMTIDGEKVDPEPYIQF